MSVHSEPLSPVNTLAGLEFAYRPLANQLNALPQGFPPAKDGSDLQLLACLFTPSEAALAAFLSAGLTSHKTIAERAGMEPGEVLTVLKDLAKRGLIRFGRGAQGAGFGLEPFVVGFYENQAATLSAEMAQRFENYYRNAFGEMLKVEPLPHRIIPVQESLANPLAVEPYESVIGIVDQAKAWAVQDCICRKQKALIGEGCDHPLEVCMAMAPVEGAFDNSPQFRVLTHDEALDVLKTCAEAGLVHSVSNTQEGNYYICNCCTCSCGFLRGIADLGVANVMASSAFVNTVDEALCIACGECVEACPFGALSLDDTAIVDTRRCTGCGVCVGVCPVGALALVRRPVDEVKPIPRTQEEWEQARMAARGRVG